MYPDDRALLLVGETANSADLYYAVQHLFGDPVIFVDTDEGDSVLVCTDFERDSTRDSTAARVRGFQDYGGAELPPDLRPHERLAALALRVLRDEGVTRAITVDSIPLSVVDHLRANGIDLVCQPELFTGPREIKGPHELPAIESVQRATEHAMSAAVELIAEARVGRDGQLYDGEMAVTSERLRAVIEGSLLEDNCTADGTITASGPDTAQPHNRGQGPIHAGQPIILDIFPRHKTRRYHSDMTRTLSKGTPNHEIVRMYDITKEALALALGYIRPGTTGRAVFEEVCRFYEDHGYATYVREQKMPEQGFIHSLGHGVGLDVHEMPGLGRRDDPIREGQIITVEPGLYAPGLGGVRIEDIVYVTADGCHNLTHFDKTLIV